MEIEKNHNFFASNYLVHNACPGTSTRSTQVYVVVDYTPNVAIATATATSTSPAIGEAGSDATVDGAANYTASSTVWSGRAAATYVAGETPVATITLAPKAGFTFAGLLAENITVVGGVVTYGGGQGVLDGGTGVSFTVTYPQLVAASGGGASTPAPIVSFAASPSSIPSGSSSILAWSSTNTTSCNVYGGSISNQGLAGSISTGLLTADTYFGLVCTGNGGTTQAQAMVSVTALQPSSGQAPTSTLSASAASATPVSISTSTSPVATSSTSLLSASSPDLLALLQTLKDRLQALIQQVLLLNLSRSPAVLGDADITPYVFTQDLALGDSGDDVYSLQLFLIDEAKGLAALTLKENGATYFFGPLTRAALQEFQASEGITPPVGYFGPKTRGVVNGR